MKLEPGDTLDTGLDPAVPTAEQVERAELIDRRQEGFCSVRVNISKKEVGHLNTCMRHNIYYLHQVAPHRKTQSLYVDDKQSKQVSALTNLVTKVGVSVPARRCRIFQVSPGVHCPLMLGKNNETVISNCEFYQP